MDVHEVSAFAELWRISLKHFMLFGFFCVLIGCHHFVPVEDFDVNARMTLLPPVEIKLDGLQSAKSLSFVFFADMQVDARLREDLRTPSLNPLRAYLEKKPVDFIVSGGDNTENGVEAEYNYIHEEVESFGLPAYWVLGNHALFNGGWNQWQKKYGTATRVLKTDLLSLYLLDNASGTIGETQRTWLAQQLKQDKARYKIMAMHFPLFSGNHFELDGQPHMREAQTLAKLFEEHGVSLVLMGHSHIFRTSKINGIDYVVLSALKENSPNKAFARVDVSEKGVKSTFVKITIDGYLE